MNLPKPTFVIVILEEESVVKKIKSFYAIDKESGYPYWTDTLPGVSFFHDKETATNIVKQFHDEAAKPQKADRDGVIRPAPEIGRALGLSDKKLQGQATIAVVELSAQMIFGANIYGEIKKPTGYTYD